MNPIHFLKPSCLTSSTMKLRFPHEFWKFVNTKSIASIWENASWGESCHTHSDAYGSFFGLRGGYSDLALSVHPCIRSHQLPGSYDCVWLLKCNNSNQIQLVGEGILKIGRSRAFENDSIRKGFCVSRPPDSSSNGAATFCLRSHTQAPEATQFCLVFCICVYSWEHFFPCIYRVIIIRCSNN